MFLAQVVLATHVVVSQTDESFLLERPGSNLYCVPFRLHVKPVIAECLKRLKFKSHLVLQLLVSYSFVNSFTQLLLLSGGLLKLSQQFALALGSEFTNQLVLDLLLVVQGLQAPERSFCESLLLSLFHFAFELGVVSALGSAGQESVDEPLVMLLLQNVYCLLEL